jgi:hypothetical protein
VSSCARNALALDKSASTLSNLALTWKFINRPDLAYGLSTSALVLAPQNQTLLKDTLGFLMASGSFKAASELIERNGYASDEHSDLPVQVVEYSNFCASAGITDQQLIFEHEAALSVLTQNRKRIRGATVSMATDPDGGSSMVIQLNFLGDVTQEIVLESELAKILMTSPDWDPCKLSVELSYISANVSQPA